MRINRNNGVTLLELLIAMTLIILVMSLGSGVLLSFNNIAQGTITSSQAVRNAQIALMHMEKNICNASSNFILYNNDSSVEYRAYTDIYLEPSITSGYEYDITTKEIRYFPNKSNPSYIIVASHIDNCKFSKVQTDGVLLHIEITALDNNNDPKNTYTVDTWVEARATASPAVY